MSKARLFANQIGEKTAIPPELILAVIQATVNLILACRRRATGRILKRMVNRDPGGTEERLVREGMAEGLSQSQAIAVAKGILYRIQADPAVDLDGLCEELTG